MTSWHMLESYSNNKKLIDTSQGFTTSVLIMIGIMIGILVFIFILPIALWLVIDGQIKHKKGKPLTSKEKVMAWNVYHFLQHQHPDMHVSDLRKETALATGIGELAVTKLLKERRQTGSFSTPGKTRPGAVGNRTRLNKYDDFTRSAIRRKVHTFFFRNEPPTIQKLLRAVNSDEELDLNLSSRTLRRIIKELKIKFCRRGRKSVLIDRDDIVSWRHRYLRSIKKYRTEGRPIYFLDETWTNAGATTARAWTDMTIESSRFAFLNGFSSGLKSPSGKGERLIILHVGNERGFVEGAQWVHRTKGTQADYHHDMNGQTFESWFFDTFLPKLPDNSVIVMDNAPYHSVREEKIPTSNSRKADIQAWLTKHGIPWDERMLKRDLYTLVKQNRAIFLKYRIDERVSQLGRGCTVLRLPPYHCELNPIEMVWSQVKRYVAQNNTTFKIQDVENLTNTALSLVTPEQWNNYCQHVIKVEDKMWELDGLAEDVVEAFIINPADTSESEESSGSETDDGVEEMDFEAGVELL